MNKMVMLYPVFGEKRHFSGKTHGVFPETHGVIFLKRRFFPETHGVFGETHGVFAKKKCPGPNPILMSVKEK